MKYRFTNGFQFNKEFRFVFLCGSSFSERHDDKRRVLKSFLESCEIEKNLIFRPIILEENFIFKRDKSSTLFYDDINLRNLYQVESLVNYLADYTIIIHESISTGAETGLFLSNPRSWDKTCLIIPDVVAVEEDKLGNFLRLAMKKMNPAVTIIRFSPKLQKHAVSNDLNVWHTYFYNEGIGDNLANEIKAFMRNGRHNYRLSFSSDKDNAYKNNTIYYDINDSKLKIDIIPRALLSCILCILSEIDIRRTCFEKDNSTIYDVISKIDRVLKDTFINTIEEIEGDKINACSIRPRMNVNDIRLSNVIGMCLYLMHAAGLIDIKKKGDKVEIVKKVITVDDRKIMFYDLYSDGITKITPNRIV